MGCASGPGRSGAAHTFSEVPPPADVAVSQRQVANTLLGRAILDQWLADPQMDNSYSLSASVNRGVVVLGGNLPNGGERRRVTVCIQELPNVTSVTGHPGELEPIVAQRTGE